MRRHFLGLRSRTLLTLAILALPATAATAAAEQAPAYRNLPGVTPLDPLGSTSRLECEQVLVDRARDGMMPSRGPRYNTVNVCRRDGGPAFTSPRLPPSIYRQLRGFSY